MLKIADLRCLHKRWRLASSGHGTFLNKILSSGVLYVHIPKTGGKSVINGLYSATVHEGFGHAGIEFYKSIFTVSEFGSLRKIAMVRNPWDRLYSAYCFAKKGGFGFEVDLDLQARISLETDGTFESFVMEWLNHEVLSDYVILNPQTNFVCNDCGEVLVDEVFYFEKFGSLFDQLSSDLGRTFDVPHVNKSTNGDDWLVRFTSSMYDKTAELYSDDLDVFGYG